MQEYLCRARKFFCSPYLSWLSFLMMKEEQVSGGGGPVFGPREFMALTKQQNTFLHFSFWSFYMFHIMSSL